MARKNTTGNEQLSPAELEELRQRLAAMSRQELEISYKAFHNACRYNPLRAPCPLVMQEFVQAWKEYRRRGKR
jgi:hypothetical protein